MTAAARSVRRFEWRIFLIGIVCQALVAPLDARAAHPLITDDTATQGAGGFQLELNAETTRDRRHSVLTEGFQPAAVLTYGITDTLDIAVGRAYLRQATVVEGTTEISRGGLDTSLDFKWRFYKKDGLSFGLKPGITVPTGNEERGFGAGKATFGTLFIASWEKDRYAVHGHAGLRRHRNTVDQRETLTQFAAAVILKATHELNVILDFAHATDPDRAASGAIRYATLGLIYSPRKDLDLDFGWRRAASATALDHSFLFGMTLRW